MVKGALGSGEWRLLDLSYPTASENLALEEALARYSVHDTFRPTVRLWIDPPAVIVGRFQKVTSEADVEECVRHGIQIARRFTGGGAVFHDEGNVNFTIVTRRPEKITLNQFHERNFSTVLSLLDHYGVEATYVPPNSIHVSGRKISGAASAMGRDFALWHASILVSSNTALLNRVLLPGGGNDETRFVRSKWHPVTTLKESLGRGIDIEEAKLLLVRSFEELFQINLEASGLFDEERRSFATLHARKYSSQEWNLHGNIS